jgi:hypothetical protein
VTFDGLWGICQSSDVTVHGDDMTGVVTAPKRWEDSLGTSQAHLLAKINITKSKIIKEYKLMALKAMQRI